MKNKVFVTRVCNLILVVGILISYQLVLNYRSQQENIGELTAEKESLQAQVEAYETEILTAVASQADAKREAELTAEQQTGGYKDGVYTGEAQGFGGPIQVEVTVEEGAISNLEIVSAEQEDAAFLGMAEGIIDVILDEQTTDVDTISGATYSSTGIRNAAEAALEQAVAE